MTTDVRVPTTGNAGEDAVVTEWNVSVGDQVSAGDVLVVLETAKATLDVEAPVSGEVLKIYHEAGSDVPEHEVLAVLGKPGETFGDATATGVASTPDDMGGTAPAHPSPAVLVESHSAGHGPSHSAQGRQHEPGARISASPKARRLARERGIELAGLAGRGPGGRVLIADVLAADAQPRAAAAAPASPAPLAAPAPAPSSPTEADYTVIPVRGARKVTAQRMHESLQSTAQVTLTRYAEADAMLRFVARLRAVTEAAGLPKVGVNDVLLFATSRAVARHPEANSWFGWDGIKRFRSVNLGFAVDTGQALLVPVIPGADKLSLVDLAAQSKSAIEKARAGKLTGPEMDGGTFTVSNLGSMGIHWFTPVLNPPQSCILGVGATHKSHPDAPSLLPLSLTFDHRAIDGAAAAAVLAEIARCIETVDVLAAF